MNNTKRWIASAMALMMASSLTPANAFAEDNRITLDPEHVSGAMTAMLDVKAQYTVTIPAAVTLSRTDETKAPISAEITTLDKGATIRVTLAGASNTANGTEFTVMNDTKDSQAHYTIKKGETLVAVGDPVAEFTETGSQELTFSAASGNQYAGTHTEELTFSILMEEASTEPSLAITNAPTEPLLYNTEGTLTAQLRNSADTVTWSCDNPDIIDLNSSTGKYRIKGYGEATITATAGTLTDTCKITGTTTFTPETFVEGAIIRPGDSLYTVTSGEGCGIFVFGTKEKLYYSTNNTAVVLYTVQNGYFGETREGSNSFSNDQYQWQDDLEGYRLKYALDHVVQNVTYKLYSLEPVYKTDTGN